MPIVRVTMAAGRSKEQKTALARDITEALMRRCGADASNVNILFEDVELDHWLVGSDVISEPRIDSGDL